MALDPKALWAEYKAAILAAIGGFFLAVAGGAEYAKAAIDALSAIVKSVLGF